MQLRISSILDKLLKILNSGFCVSVLTIVNKSDNYMLGVSYCKFKCYCSRKTSKPKNLISEHTITAKT